MICINRYLSKITVLIAVFTMLYAKYLASEYSFKFKQEYMGKFWKNIYEEIKTAKLEDIIWDGEKEFEL